MLDVKSYMQQLGQQARLAGREVSRADSGRKNQALLNIAAAISAASAALIGENAKDLQAGRENGLDAASLDRLELTPARINAMVDGLKQVAALPDPVGEISNLSYRPSGIQVGQMRVPLGVIGIIYESRPNVTIDAYTILRPTLRSAEFQKLGIIAMAKRMFSIKQRSTPTWQSSQVIHNLFSALL